MNDAPPATIPYLHRLIISAPFGNYVQPSGATATLGTFTAQPRPGRLWRILRTVRYYPRLRAWVNRIGLRNPGIAWLADRVRRGRIDVSDKIISIHGFDEAEWRDLLHRSAALRPLAVELNMSCPNVGQIDWPATLFADALAAMGTQSRVIVKLPPINFQTMLHQVLDAGVRTLHCCNTLPVPAGGISGKPLKPVAIQCIREVRRQTGDEVNRDLTIIGGGGITSSSDIDDYADAGATHAAIGTKVFNPIYLCSTRSLRPLIEHADRRLGGP